MTTTAQPPAFLTCPWSIDSLGQAMDFYKCHVTADIPLGHPGPFRAIEEHTAERVWIEYVLIPNPPAPRFEPTGYVDRKVTIAPDGIDSGLRLKVTIEEVAE